MSDDDLIRRGDALQLVEEYETIHDRISLLPAAIPAREVVVPQNVITQLNVTVGEVGLEMVQDAEDAEFTGERPDLHDYQVSIHYDHAVAILAALAPTDAAQAPFRIEDMTLADLMRDPLYEAATTPAPDAAQAREAHLREAAAAVRARYMGDNTREDQEVLRCEAAILTLIGDRP